MKEAEVRVRPLGTADLDRVVDLAQSLETAPHWPRAAYARILEEKEPRRVALVAEEAAGGAVAGFAIAVLLPPEAEIETVAVAPGRQRRGIGSRLLGDLVARLATVGITLVHLEVRASNRAALALYGRAGFSERTRRSRYYADPVEDAVILTRGQDLLRELGAEPCTGQTE